MAGVLAGQPWMEPAEEQDPVHATVPNDAGRDRWILRLDKAPSPSLVDTIEAYGLDVVFEHEQGVPYLAVRGPGDAVDRASRDDAVAAVDPDPVYQLQYHPNDPLRHEQWGLVSNDGARAGGMLASLELGPSWGLPGETENGTPLRDTCASPLGAVDPLAAEDARRDACIVVAVLDTGVDMEHPDLEGRGWLPPVDLTDDGDTRDAFGHGTHVAGIVAATSDNGEGIASPAGNTRTFIDPIKVLNAEGFGFASWVAAGIIDATDRGADIISMSLGGPAPSDIVEDAIGYARERGVMVVASAGNDYGDPVSYPGGEDGVLAVSAYGWWDDLAAFSSTGPAVDISAPGSYIPSTLPTYSDYLLHDVIAREGGWSFLDSQELYGELSGTSMAAPYVSSVAAMLWAAMTDDACETFEGCTWWADGPIAQRIQLLLEATADDEDSSGWDPAWGWGEIEAFDAADALTGTAPDIGDPAPEPGAGKDETPSYFDAGDRWYATSGPSAIEAYSAVRTANHWWWSDHAYAQRPSLALEYSLRIDPLVLAELTRSGSDGAQALGAPGTGGSLEDDLLRGMVFLQPRYAWGDETTGCAIARSDGVTGPRSTGQGAFQGTCASMDGEGLRADTGTGYQAPGGGGSFAYACRGPTSSLSLPDPLGVCDPLGPGYGARSSWAGASAWTDYASLCPTASGNASVVETGTIASPACPRTPVTVSGILNETAENLAASQHTLAGLVLATWFAVDDLEADAWRNIQDTAG